jgi:hypothetical protein
MWGVGGSLGEWGQVVRPLGPDAMDVDVLGW